MDLLVEQLKEYGLSEKESKVYVSTLMLGSSKVNNISKKAELIRETTYAILKALGEKGLVSSVIKSGVRYYSAASPKKLIELLDEKKGKITKILSDLENIQKFNLQKPLVEFYEGSEGLMTATDDMIRTEKKEVLAYINTSILSGVTFYHPGFRLRRREKKVFMKVIAENSKETTKLQNDDKKEYRQTIINNDISKDINCGLYIYEDKILYIKVNQKEQYGIIIQDKELAELQKRCYSQIWVKSKKKSLQSKNF